MIGVLRAQRPAPARVAVDIGDDAAVRDDGVVVTVDTLVQGRHFRADAPAATVGFKALAVSVSDVLSMGAKPEHAVLALSLPAGPGPWLDGFAAGLAEACARYDVDLIGGDTTGTDGPIVVSLTLLGKLWGTAWQRSGARPGDALLVTGALGLAGAGWMSPTPSEAAVAALQRPQPPLAFARAVAASGLTVHAAMDLSDGLAMDAPRMARASGLALRIDPDALPVHPSLRDDPQRLRYAVCGGEDYQLLLAVAPHVVPHLHDRAAATDTRLTAIGTATPGRGADLIGRAWPAGSFDHFGAS